MDPTLKLIMKQLTKINAGQEKTENSISAMSSSTEEIKNNIQDKINAIQNKICTGQDNIKNNMV
jgi:hypothetical protein